MSSGLSPHGTRARYQYGGPAGPCRCGPCTDANRVYKRSHSEPSRGHVTDDELQVACWCQLHIVWVPRKQMLAGLTLPCGVPACQAMHDAALTAQAAS